MTPSGSVSDLAAALRASGRGLAKVGGRRVVGLACRSGRLSPRRCAGGRVSEGSRTEGDALAPGPAPGFERSSPCWLRLRQEEAGTVDANARDGAGRHRRWSRGGSTGHPAFRSGRDRCDADRLEHSESVVGRTPHRLRRSVSWFVWGTCIRTTRRGDDEEFHRAHARKLDLGSLRMRTASRFDGCLSKRRGAHQDTERETMDGTALALTIVAMGGFPAAMSHGVVISLGEASFTASLGEAPTRH